MSFSTYAALQLEVGNWLARDDLVANIPSFITLAESEIARVLRRTSRRATVSVSEESFVLPSTIAELRSLRFVTAIRRQDTPIKIVTPEVMAETRARHDGVAGRPKVASVIGGSLVFAPVPDVLYDMEIVYFEKLVPLSDSRPSNVVLAEAPDVYLYGALREAAGFLEHDERIQIWSAKFSAALLQLENARSREEFGASLQVARLPVVF